MVEQQPFKLLVGGSSPPGRTILLSWLGEISRYEKLPWRNKLNQLNNFVLYAFVAQW